MSAPAWRAALRIAGREAWRHKARSLVVIALVGLPILAITAGDVLYRTWQLSPDQQVQRVIGSSSAWLQWYGQPHLQQSADGSETEWSGTTPARQAPTTAQVAADLRTGSRVIAYRNGPDPLTFYTRAGLDYAQFIGLEYADPLASGMVEQLSGRAPSRRGEVAITSALASDTGLGTGDTLRTTGPRRDYRITAVVRTTQAPHDRSVYGLPAAVPTAPISNSGVAATGWLVHTDRPVSWTEVRHLDQLGFVTLSRGVYLHPSPAATHALNSGSSGSNTAAIAAVVLVSGMAILEVVLLAGPAFAVGARRKLRDLALLAATGGTPADLRRSVLADAVVLGLVAGLCGAALGVVAAAVAEPLVVPYVTHLPGTFAVAPLDVGLLVLIGLGTALLAALAPAVRTARMDVVATLGGRRGTIRTRRRWPMLGLVLAGLGVLTGLAGGSAQRVLAGVALIEVGVIVATPALIGFVALGARWLPLSGRIALRDAGRTRAASTPAVAAVMAATIGATAALIVAASTTSQDRSEYHPTLPRRDAFVDVTSHPGDSVPITAALRRIAPDADVTTVRFPAGSCAQYIVQHAPRCITVAPFIAGNTQFATTGALPAATVAGASDVAALYGRPEPRAAAALAAGRLVIGVSGRLAGGEARVTVVTADGRTLRSVRLPATAVAGSFTPTVLIIPPVLLPRLGLRASVAGVLLDTPTGLTSRQQQALNLVLARTGHPHPVQLESGYHSSVNRVLFVILGLAAFVAVLAALLATVLANIDSRPDLVTLGAVGASPRTRRVLAMSRAGVIAGLGCAIGAIAGIVPASSYVHSRNTPLTVPWVLLVALVLGVPAITALLAGTGTRARLPSE